MSVDRRSVLRAAMGGVAAGAVVGGCAPGTPRPARPAAPSATPSPAALPATLPDQIEHGPRDRPLVALTFHGQGDPALATALLTAAEHAGAHVTVLAVGSWLDAYPRIARRILDGGHELGNHTQNHGPVCTMAADAAAAEINRCADRLRRLTGSPGRWFRPSQARYATPLVISLARKAGYPHVLSYDVDSLDWTDPGPQAVTSTVLGQVRPGSVVSLHLGHEGTVRALPGLLAGLGRRGLRAVTATGLLT
ncbi:MULTISPECIES: polysaccharide deacetylase family protein [Streptomycetaceae]|uniref:Polysaccharide deacetylase n=1 Tax=Streptantibioticus cattleyicolor (strain ATCC 35852 / DSM 46488 / JCM 4925 / NBRC 14057 / NRRL 8057) TaxID=1003195 RepID=F8K1G8_STREN|nr:MULTISPECIES: polysaccharide deacetylase family protein [Streptomycetaceae]AEW97462.1 polysaccharide deacetylase [Streptantibioticus cattleyicolor NRRL 8057 = DSM 46488]MYS61897.1 polysaccharide deacetylase family protein [Streptomyces sp. SID5468]CCB77783.1 Polysaccharide deacetylase [Streptantibioticus cattleyicolor NRRL 8057 = DSM 46488]